MNFVFKKILCCLLLVQFAVSGVNAESFEVASTSATQDLKEALSRLSAMRNEIKDAKIPLSKEYNALKEQVLKKRRDVERLQSIRDNKAVELSTLKETIRLQKEESDYLKNLLEEYLRSLETHMDVSEIQTHDTVFLAAKESLDRPDADKAEQYVALGNVLLSSIERFENLLGGHTFEGVAVTSSSVQEQGAFLRYGPLTYFSSQESDEAGLVQASLALQPSVLPISADASQAIRDVITNKAGDLPIDATQGDALAIREVEESILDHMRKGGIWMYPILLLAAFALLVAVFKCFDIFSVRQPNPEIIHELLEKIVQGKEEAAKQAASQVTGPFGGMLQDAVKYHASPREVLDEVLYEHSLKLQPKLERFLPFLSVTAATAPLLGLLGTVTGMIHTFNLIKVHGTGDAGPLSSGISEALVTTEYGLVLAIPALMIHAFLHRKSIGILANMDKFAMAFQNGLPKLKEEANGGTQ